MAKIPTVAGPVDSSQLGVALIHEHLCFRANPEYQDKAMDYQVMLARKAAEAGIDTMIDCTPYPDVRRIIELNERVGELNLILSTGAYLENVGSGADDPVRQGVHLLDERGMVDHMGKNLTEGYDGFENADIRAGVIKVAARTSELSEWEKKNFRAAARVQRELKVPIISHACAGAREQMEYLRANGADIGGTLYSHVEAKFGWEGRSLEEQAAYLSDITRCGGYLQFNNFDFEFDTPFGDMLYLINYLENDGFGDKIFISIDANWTFDEEGRVWHEGEKEHPETGKRTYAYAITNAAPMLLAAGVSLQRIWKYLVDNPRRYFEAMSE